MMKHNLLIIIFFTIVGCAFGQKKDRSFFDKLLNDFSRNSSFVLVKIGLENKGINYLIENNKLDFKL